jgi:hypothetical protein
VFDVSITLWISMFRKNAAAITVMMLSRGLKSLYCSCNCDYIGTLKLMHPLYGECDFFLCIANLKRQRLNHFYCHCATFIIFLCIIWHPWKAEYSHARKLSQKSLKKTKIEDRSYKTHSLLTRIGNKKPTYLSSQVYHNRVMSLDYFLSMHPQSAQAHLKYKRDVCVHHYW